MHYHDTLYPFYAQGDAMPPPPVRRRGDHVEGMPGYVYINPQWPAGKEPCVERCSDDDCAICNAMREQENAIVEGER